MSKASHQPKLMRNLKSLRTISIWDVHPRASGMEEPPTVIPNLSSFSTVDLIGVNTMMFSQRQSQATSLASVSFKVTGWPKPLSPNPHITTVEMTKMVYWMASAFNWSYKMCAPKLGQHQARSAQPAPPPFQPTTQSPIEIIWKSPYQPQVVFGCWFDFLISISFASLG